MAMLYKTVYLKLSIIEKNWKQQKCLKIRHWYTMDNIVHILKHYASI